MQKLLNSALSLILLTLSLALEAGRAQPALLIGRWRSTDVSPAGISAIFEFHGTLPAAVVASVSYLGNKGTDILTTTYTNTVNPRTGVPPYPQFGVVSWRGNDSNSTFHALQLNVRRQFQKGWLLSATYMSSHSINDGQSWRGRRALWARGCTTIASDKYVIP